VSILLIDKRKSIKSNPLSALYSYLSTAFALLFFISSSIQLTAQKLRCTHDAVVSSIDDNRLKSENRSTFILQVVVHVVWNQDEENISDERISNQISRINEDFNKLNEDIDLVPDLFQDLIGNAEIKFELAKEDPFGTPTNGINRRQTDIKTIGSTLSSDQKEVIKYSTLGGIDAWDTNHYINIWVGRTVEVFGLTATLSSAGTKDDGIIITPEAFGEFEDDSSITNKGRTLTHELGHYFGLIHLWGRDNGCGTDDDGIVDTPEQERPYSGCKIFPQVSCGSVDMNMNFMDFSNDTCLLFFTNNQVQLMRDVLTTIRSGIIVSDEDIFIPKPLEDIEISVHDNTLLIRPASVIDGPVFIEFYSISGQPLHKETLNILNDHRINTNYLPKGVYILSIRTANQRFTDTFAAGF